MTSPVYLDFLASTPVDPDVARLVYETMLEYPGNPSSRTHEFGNRAKKRLEEARRDLAETLEASPSEVFFTSGATESNNLAILGLAEFGREQKRTHIVTTAIEHQSVLGPVRRLAGLGFDISEIAPQRDGRVREEEVLDAVRGDTLLVSVMAANNETGMIQPVQPIIEGLKDSATFVHVDAAQSFGKIDNGRAGLQADLVSVSGHKFGAPIGVGALVVRRSKNAHRSLTPIAFGGSQERGFRPGTTPVALAVGLAHGAQMAIEKSKSFTASAEHVRDRFLQLLTTIPFEIVGDIEYCLPHCLSISFPGIDAEAVFVMAKDIAAISNGSACSSSGHSNSHVLEAMSLSQESMDSTLRISFSPTTPTETTSKLAMLIGALGE